MTTVRQIREQFKSAISQNKRPEFFAFLGNTAGTVEADVNGNVNILDFNANPLIVYNNKVPNIPRRAVVVGYAYDASRTLEVLRFVDAYPHSRTATTPSHGESHTWGSYDPAWIRTEQILSCLAIPDTGFTIQFIGFVYYLNGYHFINNQTVSFENYIPATGARWILVEADEDAVVTFLSGSLVGSRLSLTYEDIPTPTSGKYPLFAVKVYPGQTTFQKNKNSTDIIGLNYSGFTPSEVYRDTKMTVEAMTGVIDGAIAYATDVNKFGTYNGFFWQWEGVWVGRYAPSNIFEGMIWYDTTGEVAVAFIFSSSDNSQYIGLI